jgi:adenylosuccinate synthase
MKKINISVILGLGYGDEGKGVAVNYLCSQANKPLVVRFSGGHQVGHTVVHNKIKHIFSNFGSGTLQGVPTYWSEHCTINPAAVLKEGDSLREKGIQPTMYINANAMVTTPYDIYSNQKSEKGKKHGSVGVGFGSTIQRNEDHYCLFVRDLKYPAIFDAKLKNIAEKYYNFNPDSKVIEEFKKACQALLIYYDIVNSINDIIERYDNLIFEGSQGILLDMDYGFYPNVTRSNTTSENAWDIIGRLSINLGYSVSTYYITRAYQTRHGNGFMSYESSELDYIIDNPNETNTNNKFQGKFRRGNLDLEMLKYALDCDGYHNNCDAKYLFMTCLDQIKTETIPTKTDIIVENLTPVEIGQILGLNYDLNYYCYSEAGDVKRM